MFFIIRSGWQIFFDHPRLYWKRYSKPGEEWPRVAPVPPDDPLWTAKQDSVALPRHVGLPGLRHTIGLARWWHSVAEGTDGRIYYDAHPIEQMSYPQAMLAYGFNGEPLTGGASPRRAVTEAGCWR